MISIFEHVFGAIFLFLLAVYFAKLAWRARQQRLWRYVALSFVCAVVSVTLGLGMLTAL